MKQKRGTDKLRQRGREEEVMLALLVRGKEAKICCVPACPTPLEWVGGIVPTNTF